VRSFVFTFLICTGLYSHTPYLKENIYSLSVVNKIPKKIHQIWVGDKPIPKLYQKFMQSWKDHHPDWEYYLWTDKDIEDFPWINKTLFDAAKNPGMKSDIWRYEIIYRYGGVYVDCDMKNKRPLDPMHSRLEFYASYLFVRKRFFDTLGCHLFAAPSNSDIMKDVVFTLRKETKDLDIETLSFQDVQDISGPGFWTRMIRDRVENDGNPRTVIFTPEYFHPTGCGNRGRARSQWEKENLKNRCFSTHTNGGSWADEDPDEICYDQ